MDKLAHFGGELAVEQVHHQVLAPMQNHGRSQERQPDQQILGELLCPWGGELQRRDEFRQIADHDLHGDTCYNGQHERTGQVAQETGRFFDGVVNFIIHSISLSSAGQKRLSRRNQ